MPNNNFDKYKNQDQILRDTIMLLRNFYADGIQIVDMATLATETTLAECRNYLSIISETITPSDSVQSLLRFVKNNAEVTVTESTTDPTQNIPLPVKLVDLSGEMHLNTNNLDLDVHISHDGTDVAYDSVRIGDGTNLMAVNGSFEAQVRDDDANTTLTTIETNTDFGAVTGGGAEATALRVTIANDSTGLVSIDDNGGSITVDGTVAVSVPTTMGSIINTNIDINGGVAATQIDVTTHPCKYCIIQAATTNTGQIWIGYDNTVAVNVAGFCLFPADNIKIEISNTNLLYAAASVDNQTVIVTYFN